MVWWFLNKLTTELSYDPAPVYMLTLALLWTVAHQAPLSMGFSRQEYLSGLPFPPPRDLPNPGIEPMSPALVGEFFTTEPPRKPWYVSYTSVKKQNKRPPVTFLP